MTRILCAALVLGAIVLTHLRPECRLMFVIFAALLVAMYGAVYWAFCLWFDSRYPSAQPAPQRANKEFKQRQHLHVVR